MPTDNTDNPVPTTYMPTAEEALARAKVYKNLETMRQVKTSPMPHFANGDEGNVGWMSYVDRSERFLNGYVLTRDAQGKEQWQSNLMDNTTLAKMRAIAAGVGLRVPEMSITATNGDGIKSGIRAEVFKNIIKQSFNDTNPAIHAFLELWQLMAHGTIFEYEGYKTGGAKLPQIDSFDTVTGKFAVTYKYVKFDGKPFSVIVNPQEFFWWSMKIRELQHQPRVAWVQHFTKMELEQEFGQYPNYKFIKDKGGVQQAQLQETTYFSQWSNNVDVTNDYEVIREYSKEDMTYQIWCNGVPLLMAPLLWGEKEKIYPFAKQILQPFANTNFFVGMSFPAMLEPYQQGKADLLNTLIDKLYRAVNPQKLIGLQNKDLFDVQSSLYSEDDTIYVPDIEAVKFMNHPTVNAGELQIFQILERGIESVSVDRSQQGLQSTNQKTATQSRSEDAHARELKGALYLSLEDLWLQKTRLRTQIILTHYIKDKAVQDKKAGQIITVKDYTFGDGSRGILDIHVAKSNAALLPITEVQARERAMQQQGQAYKLISITKDYLDEWVFDISIVPMAFHNQEQSAKEEDLMAEIQQVAMVNPPFLAANADKYTADILEVHGHHIDEYKPPMPPPPAMPGQPGQPPQGAPAQPGQPTTSPVAAPQGQSVLGLS